MKPKKISLYNYSRISFKHNATNTNVKIPPINFEKRVLNKFDCMYIYELKDKDDDIQNHIFYLNSIISKDIFDKIINYIIKLFDNDQNIIFYYNCPDETKFIFSNYVKVKNYQCMMEDQFRSDSD